MEAIAPTMETMMMISMKDIKSPITAVARGELKTPINEQRAPMNQMMKFAPGTQQPTKPKMANTKPTIPIVLDFDCSTMTVCDALFCAG